MGRGIKFNFFEFFYKIFDFDGRMEFLGRFFFGRFCFFLDMVLVFKKNKEMVKIFKIIMNF